MAIQSKHGISALFSYQSLVHAMAGACVSIAMKSNNMNPMLK